MYYTSAAYPRVTTGYGGVVAPGGEGWRTAAVQAKLGYGCALILFFFRSPLSGKNTIFLEHD